MITLETRSLGAMAIRRDYNRNLGLSFGGSVLVLLLILLGIRFVIGSGSSHAAGETGDVEIRIGAIPFVDRMEPQTDNPAPSKAVGGGDGARRSTMTGRFVGAPDETVGPDVSGIHDSAGGNGPGDLPDGPRGPGGFGEMEMKVPSPTPPKDAKEEDIDEGGTPVEVREAVIDLAAIQGLVRYPARAVEREIEGTVKIRVLIGASGRVEKTKVLSSAHPLLTAAAEEAVTAASYIPATANGRPVPAWYTIPIRFELKDVR